MNIIKTFNFNYASSRYDYEYTSLEKVIGDYRKAHPNYNPIQIEFLWGNEHGARVAVLFEDKDALQGEGEDKR